MSGSDGQGAGAPVEGEAHAKAAAGAEVPAAEDPRKPAPAVRTVILYRSKHHGNTKKLVDAVVAAHPDIDVIDVASLGKKDLPDLSSYHIICFASGIYYGKFDKDVLRIAQECLRDGDNVIALMTYGGSSKFNGRDLDGICRLKLASFHTAYGCPGYDTYGPFKLMGGMNKGRPNAEDIQGAVDFYDRLLEDYGQIFIDQRAKRDKSDAFYAANPPGGLLLNIKRTANRIAGSGKRAGNAKAAGGAAAEEPSSTKGNDSKE